MDLGQPFTTTEARALIGMVQYNRDMWPRRYHMFFKNSYYFSKYVLIISIIENIISGDCKIGHCAISEIFDVDSTINCAILILNNFDHCIKESIPLHYS